MNTVWEVRTGDCVRLLAEVPSGSARLVFADPPYNIGFDYGEGRKADLMPAAEYLAWCRSWMEQLPRVLAGDGSAWVLINDEWADEFGCMLRAAGLHRRQWIIWRESFGTNCTHKFNRCHRHLFHMVKHRRRFVFHRQAFNRPSDRQTKYNDRRANPAGKNWDSVWGVDPPISRVCGTFGERVEGGPTQLPLALLTPIVRGVTDPGDLVLDPFAGSGTSGVAAIRNGRRYLGIEKNADFAGRAAGRLRSIEGDGEVA